MKILSATVLLLGAGVGNAKWLRRAQVNLPTIILNDDFYETIQEARLDVEAPGILANDTAAVELTVTGFEEEYDFQGKLKVYEDGKIRYDPPKGNFLGTDVFTYDACQVDPNTGGATENCASATVTINVIVDPNKPADNPKAVDDIYTVEEGGTLNIDEPGFLGNDEHEDGKPIYRDKRTSSPEGKIDTHKEGGFDYTAPNCWTGNDSFSYRVCYVDYSKMCDEGTVTIEVTKSNNRPNPAGVQDDRFTVREGEELDISSSNGVLSNDRPDKGQELFVEAYDKQSGFLGRLEVRSDGRVKYTPVPGKRGSFWFSYRACYSDWECVECKDAMVEIVVEENPAKPANPPSPVFEAYETDRDTRLEISSSNGVLVNDKKDSRYNLFVESSSNNGSGKLDMRSSGGFRYTPSNGFLGTDSFTYVVCYEEWPDLCAAGSGSVTVKAPSPGGDGDSSSRRGVATAYMIRWDASDDESEKCDEVEPRLSLRCEGDGELNLLDLSGSDNSNCVFVNDVLSCSAMNEGVVYAECRDGRSDNSTRRQLIATLESEAVACDVDTSESFPLSSTYHVAEVMAYCNDIWNFQDIACSGRLLNMTGTGGSPFTCYGDDVASGPMLKPETVTMTAQNYEACLFV